MGYEGHLMVVPDRGEQTRQVAAAMDLLLPAHADVGGDVVPPAAPARTTSTTASPRSRPAATR